MNDKIDILAEALDCDAASLSQDTRLETLQSWDSMAMLSVIAIARANGMVVTGAQLREMKTVGDVLAIL